MCFLPQNTCFFGKNKLRIWGVPPYYGIFPAKKELRILGVPPSPPLRTFPENFSSKRAKKCFFAQKHLILVQKIGYGFGGYPPPPLYGFFFSKKGVTDLGGTPPFTDKIRKVVFDRLPKG